MTVKQTKVILQYNLQTFIQEILESVENGWELDQNDPPCVWGTSYECRMTRADDVPEEYKITRAEILHKARAAKAAKAAAAKQQWVILQRSKAE